MPLYLYVKIDTTLYNLFVADVMTTLTMADVIAMMADGIAIHIWADVFAQCSRWNSHM